MPVSVCISVLVCAAVQSYFDSFGPVVMTAVTAYVSNNLCISLISCMTSDKYSTSTGDDVS